MSAWWRRGRDVDAATLEMIGRDLERLANAAPQPRQVEAARLRMLAAMEESVSAPASIGLMGMAAIVVALAVMVGASGLYIGTLVDHSRSVDASVPPDAAPATAEPTPSPTPEPRTQAPTPQATDGDRTDATDPATPTPSPAPLPTDDDDPGDSGPPPHVSPGGPPSPMPGPPGSGAP